MQVLTPQLVQHHFLTTGFLTFLGLVLDLVQTSLGTSTHSSVGSSLGTSLVTCLQVLWGSRVHCSLGALVHPVMGVYFFTGFLETEHTSLGHLEHLVLVVYPDVLSSRFSSISVAQDTTSSSTS